MQWPTLFDMARCGTIWPALTTFSASPDEVQQQPHIVPQATQ